MADPDQDQDDLISQDDIDRLLASSSIEEAEQSLETVDISSESDDMGELSQDDIDSLMGEQTAAGEPDDAQADSEFSQDDIDSLLNSNSEYSPDETRDETDDDFGELSQNDIDSLMGGNLGNPADDDPEEDDDPGEENRQDGDLENETPVQDEEDIELIDQADIDRLMTQSRDQELPLESAAPPESPESENTREPAARDDFVISPDQAVDPADCLVTQDTLDALMENVPETAPASDFAALDEEETPKTSSLPETDETGLDAVLLDEPAPEPNQSDVTQEDIDALLQDPDEDAEEIEEAEEYLEEKEQKDVVDLEDDDDLLISQDDIDTLLMTDDQGDEDLLEDVLGNDFEDMLDDEYSRENGEDQEGRSNDQVILEASDATETKIMADESSGTGRKWYKSKLLLAAASVLLVLAITVPAAYFLFFPRMPELPSAKQPMQPIPRVAQEMDTDNVLNENPAAGDMAENSILVEVAPVPPVARPGNMVLKNFIVLTSDQAAEMAYVTLDISIDYSDRRAYDEINSNLAFFRDLIYASIQQNLVWEKRNEVTQNDLLRGVEAGLQKVLPPGLIENIHFLSFETS